MAEGRGDAKQLGFFGRVMLSLLLRELVGALGVRLGADEAGALHARHRGNLREALRELYDAHAARRVISSAPAA